MNNDVLASLEMMLTFGQMMLCLTAQMKKSNSYELDFLEASPGFEPGDRGVADLCLTTWPCRHLCRRFPDFSYIIFPTRKYCYIKNGHFIVPILLGADYGARTRHLRLGKATLYQMS